MNTDTKNRTFVSVVLAPIWRKLRFFFHTRKDKLQLLLMMVVGSTVPIFLCWGLPTLINASRTNQTERALITAEIDQETFRENYPELLALCEDADVSQKSGSLPPEPHLLIVRNGKLDSYQDTMPDQWRAETPEQANVILCLDRENVEAVEACLDGSTPDLSMFLGYELLIGLERDFAFYRAHPEVSGRTMLRYLTDYKIIDIASGQVIDAGQISGSDPGVCIDPPEVSPLETFTGEALREEVLYYINGERLTVDGFNDWLHATLMQE